MPRSSRSSEPPPLHPGDRAPALRPGWATLTALEQRLHSCTQAAEALLTAWLEHERYPGELADELRATQHLRDRCRQLENRCRADRLRRATPAAAADEPF